jgi:hypothetical protein
MRFKEVWGMHSKAAQEKRYHNTISSPSWSNSYLSTRTSFCFLFVYFLVSVSLCLTVYNPCLRVHSFECDGGLCREKQMGDDAAVPGQGLETSSRAKLVRTPIPSFPCFLSFCNFLVSPLFRLLSPTLASPSLCLLFVYSYSTHTYRIAQGVEGWVPYIGPVEQIVNRLVTPCTTSSSLQPSAPFAKHCCALLLVTLLHCCFTVVTL